MFLQFDHSFFFSFIFFFFLSSSGIRVCLERTDSLWSSFIIHSCKDSWNIFSFLTTPIIKKPLGIKKIFLKKHMGLAIQNAQWMTLDNFQWIFSCLTWNITTKTWKKFWYSYQKAHLVSCANNQSIPLENVLCFKEGTPHNLMPMKRNTLLQFGTF